MAQNEATMMSVPTKSPIFPGLAALSAAAASKGKQMAAVDHQEAATLDEESTSGVAAQQTKSKSGSATASGSGSKSGNTTTARTSSSTTPPADTRHPLPHRVQDTRNIPKFSGRLDFSDRGYPDLNTTPRCSEEMSDVEIYDSNEEDEREEPSFRHLPPVKKNTPGRSGVRWRFVEGSDLSSAEVGKPDPSKFYLTRENIDDLNEIDVRQFSHIANFDWNNPQHVHNLNKARAQNRQRVNGKIAETRIPWTQMEKDCLVEEVREAINAGQDRYTIDWDEIAARLKSRFEGVLQKKGAKLAPGVERVPKNGHDKTLKTSRSNRTGYNRSGSATETQALKYTDILQMINIATGIGGKGGRGLLRGPRRSLSQITDGVRDENDRPAKKAKTATGNLSVSPPPGDINMHYEDDDIEDSDENDGTQNPKGRPAVSAAFASKFPKSNAKQFDANSSRN